MRDAAATQKSKLNSVQALRAIAAMSVMVTHLHYLEHGAVGVDIFFVISGFIMCHVMDGNAATFFMKRVFRLVPLYWAATIGVYVVALLAPALLNSTTADVSHLLKSLLFIPYIKGNGATTPMLFLGWTLNYEMYFYSIFSIALWLVGRRAPYCILIVFPSIVVLGSIIELKSVPLVFYSDPIILEFCLGVVGYLLWKRFFRFVDKIRPIIALTLAAAVYASLFFLKYLDSGLPRVLEYGLPSAVIFILVLSVGNKIRFPKPLLLLGDASYSLYLLHPYVIQLVDKVILPLNKLSFETALYSLFACVLCCLVAIASFRLIEKPSNQLLRTIFIGNANMPHKYLSAPST